MISTVVGIAVVVIIAVIYFSGSGLIPVQNSSESPAVRTTIPGMPSAAASPAPAGTSTLSITATDTPPVPVPDKGVIVRIDYIGSFSGSIGSNGQIQPVKNSGTQVYTLDNATGTVTASFKKEDATTKHALTVAIYKNGNLLKSGSTTSAYGNIDISAAV
jgi:hypothetical protein